MSSLEPERYNLTGEYCSFRTDKVRAINNHMKYFHPENIPPDEETEAMHSQCEIQSTINMVQFYKPELLEIHKTGKYPARSSDAERRILSKHGLVEIARSERHCKMRVTSKALNIINAELGKNSNL